MDRGSQDGRRGPAPDDERIRRWRLLRRLVAASAVVLAGVVLPTSGTAPVASAEPVPAGIPAVEAVAFLDRVLPSQLERYRIPGAAVVVVSGGRQVAARGYGSADLERDVAVDPERTGMFTGSVAKVFTATAVQQLVERGELDLDRDVNDYLSRVTVDDTFPGEPVTTRHLLTHTAGFDPAVLGGGAADDQHGRSLEEYLADQPARVRAPGHGRVSYDNYGVALAGLVVEEVSGQPFEDYVGEHVLAPLQMSGSSLAQPQPDGVRARSAKGYRVAGADQVEATGRFGPATPAGAAVTTTATDMGRFMLSQLPDPRRPVLTPDSVRALQQQQASPHPGLPGMGLLWELRTRGGHRLVTKDGDLPGAHTNLVLLPDQDAGIYVAYNGDGAGAGAWYAGKELERRFVDELFPARDADAPGTAPAPGTASAQPDADPTGRYRGLDTSRTELTAARALVGGVSLTAHPDGSLTSSGALVEDPSASTQRWLPVGAGLYRSQDGQDLLALGPDGDTLATSAYPALSYQRLAWYQSPVLHQGLLVAGLLPLLLGLGGWPVAALLRRRRGRPRAPTGARAARAVAAGTGVALVGYTAAFFVLTGDAAAFNEALFLGDSPMLVAVRVLSTLGVVGAAATVVLALLARRRRWEGRWARLHLGLAALGAVVFLAVCGYYRMLGPGLW